MSWAPMTYVTGCHVFQRARAQVRIKLKHMEIEIRRRETTGAGAAARNESETLAKYEIMDGAPVRGENIPIRFLSIEALGAHPPIPLPTRQAASSIGLWHAVPFNYEQRCQVS